MDKSTSYYLNAMGICCNIGDSKELISERLFSKVETIESMKRFLSYNEKFLEQDNGCYLGEITNDLPKIPNGYEAYESRNNRILLSLFLQIAEEVYLAISKYGTDRIAVILGTSTSGIAEGETAFFHYKSTGAFPENYNFDVQEIADGSEFISEFLGLSNMAVTISTACSSSNKTFAHAQEMMAAGICDAAIVGGVDSLCKMTVNGFNALSALSQEPCNPFSKNRSGISIGEGGAMFLMTSEPSEIQVIGVGESSDGTSMTSPDPKGFGAEKALCKVLLKANIKASDVCYINLHGTATLQNDSMESKAVSNIFGSKILCSSTKPITGHVLGASGAIEAGFCWLMLSKKYNEYYRALPQLWDGILGDDIALNNFAKVGDHLPVNKKIKYVISNSFAFGGSNTSLLLKGDKEYG